MWKMSAKVEGLLEKKQICSATDELFWDYGQGYVTANAPRMQAAVGFFTDRPIQLKDCRPRWTTSRSAGARTSSSRPSAGAATRTWLTAAAGGA